MKNTSYIVAIAGDKNTGITRTLIVPSITLPHDKETGQIMIMDFTSIGLYKKKDVAGVIEVMIQKYIDKDKDLTHRDTPHFCNWCASYTSLTKFQKKKLGVQALIHSYDTMEEAKAFVETFQKETA